MNPLPVNPGLPLVEGKVYNGRVISVELTKRKYDYVDTVFELEGVESEKVVTLKYGTPTGISDNSKLGKLLSNFIDINEHKEIDPEAVLFGKRLSFKVTKPDKYWEIVEDTFEKPIGEPQVETKIVE